MNVEEAISGFPASLRPSLWNIAVSVRQASLMVAELLGRDMNPQRAVLVGFSLDPEARMLLEDAIDRLATPDLPLPTDTDEVIVGAGAHAAVYAAVRVANGHPKPLAISQTERFGGMFAISRQAAFFLNSRNRPGALGAPGTTDALNVIPGALMQPSDMSGSEYQTNADLGMVVRCTLALNATVRTAKVEAVGPQQGNRIVVETDRGQVRAGRVVIATGIGQQLRFTAMPSDNERVFRFSDFMRRCDTMFPLRDLGRVAVVGAGDSGRTVVEALTGYGPQMGGSVASLDWVPRIDWYGKEMAGMTKEKWLECNRTRYKPLAALFPLAQGRSENARVRGFNKVTNVFAGYESVTVGARSYDTVIVCLGFKTGSYRAMVGLDTSFRPEIRPVRLGTTNGAPLGLATANDEIVVVGPAADLQFTAGDPTNLRSKENRVSLFRLVPRTAALAQLLPPA